MKVRVTESGRWQLRSAAETLARRRDGKAAQFVAEVGALLANRTAIDDAKTRICGCTGVPVSEIVLHGYLRFFRTVDDTLWLTGVWHAPHVG